MGKSFLIKMHSSLYIIFALITFVTPQIEKCTDFTVGACDPESDELIDMYPSIPNQELCQTVCVIQEGCNFFRYSKSSLECTLYHYRFLTSCNLIAGPKGPLIDTCMEAGDPSCDDFVRENCLYMGNEVLKKDSITDPHACQDLLINVGFIYSAVYFSFDSNAQVCTLYDSMDMDCDAISGPRDPLFETCAAGPTTAAPTEAPTTAPPTTGTNY